ncbi:prolyl oligopeptidase family serine peptidase [Paenibacillus sp. FSL W8-0186]|uniref:S9 family peptidase n=1 Tax=Paenibacillus sp. FSL W8-0186 TaxID=2921709 RepID=UPI0030D56955
MAKPALSPCGSWKSPITAQDIAQSRISFQEILVDQDIIYWVESRPTEQGRYVIVRADEDGEMSDVTPPGYSARTLVNSYGGGSFTLSGGTVYFSNFVASSEESPYARHHDQRLFRQKEGSAPEPLTDTLSVCYADGVYDSQRGRLISVREDGQLTLHGQGMQSLVSIDPVSGQQEMLAYGNDFYAAPRLSPDGKRLCWLTWNYPSMPWDGSELWVADVNDEGMLCNPKQIAGGTEEAIFQPEWSPQGELFFISDRTNWWNLYRWDGDKTSVVYQKAADFGAPQWTLRMAQYDFIPDGRVVCSYVEQGAWRLAVIDVHSNKLTDIPSRYTEISHLRAGTNFVAFLGGAHDTPLSVVKLSLETMQETVIKSSLTNYEKFLPYVSKPEPITFVTSGNGQAYAFYYPPHNLDFGIPVQEKPPLIIKSHGGPTSAASTALDLEIQYFTSRGFAVVDVNYRGSTGYGREYRLSLYGNWGIYDKEDCISAAKYLEERGEIDGERILARGGSAGGFTTLCLLAFSTICRAGASYYGVSDLEKIVVNSDKLEAKYPFRLIGKYPEQAELYRERSPAFHAERITNPAIFFQGLEDPIVPPEQTEGIVSSLTQRGVPVAAFYYPHEQHGFRIAANIKKSLEAELYFYSQILQYTPADPLEPFPINNLK